METQVYNFSNIRFADLQKMVSIRPKRNLTKFEEWFSFDYPLSDEEISLLEKLIEKHALMLPAYQEEDLKMKFLSPIFNQVDFFTSDFHEWYEPHFSGKVNGYELKGFVNFMVAKGFDVPEKPYFFIQEFKPSIPDKNPEYQLLAEMLVAIEKNQTSIFRGGYIIGQLWKFVILEKIAENQFEYFVSEAFDSLKIKDLKQIYVNLQAVKLIYCQD
ncbi:MAG: hypothetical protein JJT94_13860 [Bernardetiaceae bacterium]|nr:hypothetical protein [Bernardetiaceae bacterium]